ncbi:blue copper protein-like [Nicotiana tabacum]|uniref:Blue copper protein n=3 Tax=Nicotiana tabacum TaxID=4097 RepID=A0A1S3Y681_TOBAC|nr:blue copper protein-like [Nicotiana tomentosiformis]XP_016447402.1 PREDICTED: blue copper protein-like [Nicotiana tabacum]
MATFATKLMCLFLILGLASPSFATDIVNIDWSLEASLDLDLTLNVGDVVVFNYIPKLHDVVQVDIDGYKSCVPTNILYRDDSGKTTITLDKAGVRQYISSVATDCLKGLKITITVL